MSGFYASITTLGIILISIALFMILMDWKKSSNDDIRVEKKKKELETVITDAEMLVEEMNRFSEYIVEQIDKKIGEYNTLLDRAAGLQLQKNEVSKEEEKEEKEEKEEIHLQPSEKLEPKATTDKQSTVKKRSGTRKTKSVQTAVQSGSMNPKYDQVYKFSEEGMEIDEIARVLNIGKGEIQLVLGMRK